jgi:sporulation protein YpjB
MWRETKIKVYSNSTPHMLLVGGGTRMKAKILLIFVLLFFIYVQAVHTSAETTNQSQLKQLNDLSDQTLLLVKRGKFEEAKQLLDYFSNEFMEMNLASTTLSMDQIRILTLVHEQATEALNAVSMEDTKRINHVLKFRLVVDALQSNHQPLWTELEDRVMKAFYQMKSSAKNGDVQAFQHHLNIFLNDFNTIHSAVMIDLTRDENERLQSHFHFLEKYRSTIVSNSQRVKHFDIMEEDLLYLFKRAKEDEADPSLIWVMITTGSIILSSLFYAGWRKYKAEKKKAYQRQND